MTKQDDESRRPDLDSLPPIGDQADLARAVAIGHRHLLSPVQYWEAIRPGYKPIEVY